MATANLIQTSVSGRTQNALAAQGDGLILPKLSSIDRVALSLTTSDAGLEVYDTTLGAILVWDGTAWLIPSVNYSQGVWLGAFTCAVGSITEDPAIKTGFWSRIGNTVSISMVIRAQAIAGPSGQLKVITLPFAAAQQTALTIHGDLLNNGAKTTLAGYATGFDINLFHYENGNFNPLAQHVPAGGIFYISGTYITT